MEQGTAVPILGRKADACTLVIFGASGDLTKRKLLPAVYNLARHRLLSDDLRIIGFARRETSTDDFRKAMRTAIQEYAADDLDAGRLDWLESRLEFVVGEFDDESAYAQLIERLDADGSRENALFYLSTAPSFFSRIAERLCAAGLVREDAETWRRVIVEKPFGRDLESARALNAELLGCLDETQIYRIDHYLGKETVQNILAFRFANSIFEPTWNRQYVDHVQITVAESLGVEDRGGYYDQAGALRDMVPNHIFQLISLVAMEPPVSFEADAVRDEQCKVLRSIGLFENGEVDDLVVRGQYGAGEIGGRAFVDYRAEDRVDANSATETFVAMKLEIENWRWKGVPFYLRVGKALAQRRTEIVVRFKRPPLALFRNTAVDVLSRNELVIDVQPNEGIALHFGVKVPGPIMRIGQVDMDYRYADHFDSDPTVGYERLLFDAMSGDPTLFRRKDMVEAGWSVVTPILEAWAAKAPHDFPDYSAGSWGPAEADELLSRDGRSWHEPKR